jgi:hypothetical protein
MWIGGGGQDFLGIILKFMKWIARIFNFDDMSLVLLEWVTFDIFIPNRPSLI